MEENINDIRETQKEMEAQFGQLVLHPNSDKSATKLENATRNLKAATHAVNRSLKQNPLGNDVFQKIEIDR